MGNSQPTQNSQTQDDSEKLRRILNTIEKSLNENKIQIEKLMMDSQVIDEKMRDMNFKLNELEHEEVEVSTTKNLRISILACEEMIDLSPSNSENDSLVLSTFDMKRNEHKKQKLLQRIR